MSDEHQFTQDKIMTSMLAMGYSMDIGTVALQLRESQFRDSKLSELDLDSGDNAICNLLSRFDQFTILKGYLFSWGTLSEKLFPQDEDGDLSCFFEFSITEVLKALPDSGMVEDLFIWMYQNHPECHPKYDANESITEWFILTFTANGKNEVDSLRFWIATEFIPNILPDLINEAILIIDEAKEVQQLLHKLEPKIPIKIIETKRNQLCGNPENLSFKFKKISSRKFLH